MWLTVALVLVVLLLAVQAAVLVGLVLNVNKLLERATGIRRQLKAAEDTGIGAQLTETRAQLESLAVSLDRIAVRCDGIDSRLAEAAQGKGPASLGPEAVAALREGVGSLHEPLREIRDLLGRTKTERLADEIKRTLHNMGYDRVTIRTDLAVVDDDDGKVQVEVAKDGVTSKGYVVIRDQGVVDQKISKPYEMFP